MQLTPKQKVLILLLLVAIVLVYLGMKFVVHKPYEDGGLAGLDAEQMAVFSGSKDKAVELAKAGHDQLLQQYQTLKNKRIVLDDDIANLEQKLSKIDGSTAISSKTSEPVVADVAKSKPAEMNVPTQVQIPLPVQAQDQAAQQSVQPAATEYSDSGNIFSRLRDKFNKKSKVSEKLAKMAIDGGIDQGQGVTVVDLGKKEADKSPLDNKMLATASSIAGPPAIATATTATATAGHATTSDMNNLIATLQKDDSTKGGTAKSAAANAVNVTANANPSVSVPSNVSNNLPSVQPDDGKKLVAAPVVTTTTVAVTTSATTPTTTHTNVASQEIGVSKAVTTKQMPGKVIVITPKEKTAVKEKIVPQIKQAKLVAAQDADYFVLQVMSGNKQKFITDYIKAHGLEGKAVCLKTQRDGKGWFILAYGHYADQQAAKADVVNVKAALKSVKPWIKPIKAGQYTQVE